VYLDADFMTKGINDRSTRRVTEIPSLNSD